MTADPIREQYEALPYPARNPADEEKRLIIGSPSHLLEVNHYIFGGRRDFSQPFRALVAGGGTGDAAIMLAQQLTDAGQSGEVFYTDISQASRDIAEARAAARRLENISFQNYPIEELSAAELGYFDYIDCCGVLHHLVDPAKGLAVLAGLLTDGGGMGLMLYGELGRTGVYHVQEMLRLLDSGEPKTDRLAAARRLLAILPETNWFQRNSALRDHFEGGAAGLYDLLLHPRDRAYRVSEIYALLDDVGLVVTALVEPARYDPATYTSDKEILARCDFMTSADRASFAELIAGNIRTHVFYAVQAGGAARAIAQPEPKSVPHFHNIDGTAFAGAFSPGTMMTAELDGLSIQKPLPALTGEIARHIDGTTDIATIARKVRSQNPAINSNLFWNEFNDFYSTLNNIGKIYLTRP